MYSKFKFLNVVSSFLTELITAVSEFEVSLIIIDRFPELTRILYRLKFETEMISLKTLLLLIGSLLELYATTSPLPICIYFANISSHFPVSYFGHIRAGNSTLQGWGFSYPGFNG